jgi:hypothetical protein
LKYRANRLIRRESAALSLQSYFRAFARQKVFNKARNALLRCQGNVLARQCRRAFLKMRSDVIRAQTYIRRFLATQWYENLKRKKYELENDVEGIAEMIAKYNNDADQFRSKFTFKKISAPYSHLKSYEDFEIQRAKK